MYIYMYKRSGSRGYRLQGEHTEFDTHLSLARKTKQNKPLFWELSCISMFKWQDKKGPFIKPGNKVLFLGASMLPCALPYVPISQLEGS